MRYTRLLSKAFVFLSSFIRLVHAHGDSSSVATMDTNPHYQDLQNLIQLYEKGMQKGDIEVTACSLSMQHSQPCVQSLAQRLSQLGFLKEEKASGDRMTPEILEALHAFQKAHRLRQSDTLTQDVLKRLKKPLSYWLGRAKQNLNRWHRIQEIGSEHLIINIPEFTMHAFRGGKEIFSSPVIVGRCGRRTPQFSTYLTKIITHPTWYVPPSLASSCRGSVGSKGYRLSGGQLVQGPGPCNTLGPIKFILEHMGSILMHSTNKPALFKQRDRALSSGCIRLCSYEGLVEAMFPLISQRVQRCLKKRKNQIFHLEHPLKIHCLYLTMWTDALGRPVYFPDVYDFDAQDDEE